MVDWKRALPIAGVLALAACGASGQSSSTDTTPTPLAAASATPASTDFVASSGSTPGGTAAGTVAPAATSVPTASSTSTPRLATSRPTAAPAPPPPAPPPPPPPLSACPVSITATNYMFSPASPTIPHGCVLSMRDGSGYHTFSSSAFDSGQMNPGQTYTFVFQTPGNYAYHCMNHAVMVGTIHVT